MTTAVQNKRKRVSKKNKSSWRKHSDIGDIERFLEDQRRDERTGGCAAEKTDDQLFFVDKPSGRVDAPTAAEVLPDIESTKKQKRNKPLRCHQALLPDPRIEPARSSHNVRSSLKKKKSKILIDNTLNARGEPTLKSKHQASQRLSAHNELRERKKSTILSRAQATYDLWGDTDVTAVPAHMDSHYVEACKLRRIKLPVYYHKRPSDIPAVLVAPPGASYNPTFDDHQTLLSEALLIEQKKTKQEERLIRATDEKFPIADQAPNMTTWLKEMSTGILDDEDEDDTGNVMEEEGEEEGGLSNNPPVRREDKKTEKTRKKLKEEQDRKKKAEEEKKRNLRKQEMFRIKSLKQEVKRREMELAARQARRELQREATRNKTKKLGKMKYQEPTTTMKLSDELEGSLRLLKPEGHILEDRFRSLQQRNIIEPRLRAKRIRKYKPKQFDKKGHRDVTA